MQPKRRRIESKPRKPRLKQKQRLKSSQRIRQRP